MSRDFIERIQNFVLTLLVALVVLTMVISFGPQGGQGCQGIGNQYAARIYGRTITEGDFMAAYRATGFTRHSAERARALHLRELTMDGLVERELLAHEAETLGYGVDRSALLREIADRQTIFVSPPSHAEFGYPGPELPMDWNDRQGHFAAKNMQRFISNGLRRSSDEFAEWQVRERLAQMMRETVQQSVVLPPQEIHDQYVRETERAKVRYLQYRPTFFREQVQAADADVRTWMAAHTSEVDAEYTRQRHRFTGLEEQVRAEHVLIKAARSIPAPELAAARTRAEAILARVLHGENFATVARASSEDEGSARRGGDLGWNPRGRMVPEFDAEQFRADLAVGQVSSNLVQTEFGFHIIKVTGRRPAGDVPEADAKRELAEELYVKARATELAQTAATRALTYLREGHTFAELNRTLAYNWAVPANAPPADRFASGEPVVAAEGEAAVPERDALAPAAQETRAFGRSESPLAGAFNSGPLAEAAYGLTMEAPLPGAPLQLGEDFFVFQLTEKVEATEAAFTDDVRARISTTLLNQKRRESLRQFVGQLRRQADQSGDVRSNAEMLNYGDGHDPGDEPAAPAAPPRTTPVIPSAATPAPTTPTPATPTPTPAQH